MYDPIGNNLCLKILLAVSSSVSICQSISFSFPLKERNKNEYYFTYSPVLLLGRPICTGGRS